MKKILDSGFYRDGIYLRRAEDGAFFYLPVDRKFKIIGDKNTWWLISRIFKEKNHQVRLFISKAADIDLDEFWHVSITPDQINLRNCIRTSEDEILKHIKSLY